MSVPVYESGKAFRGTWLDLVEEEKENKTMKKNMQYKEKKEKEKKKKKKEEEEEEEEEKRKRRSGHGGEGEEKEEKEESMADENVENEVKNDVKAEGRGKDDGRRRECREREIQIAKDNFSSPEAMRSDKVPNVSELFRTESGEQNEVRSGGSSEGHQHGTLVGCG
ncbi:unnamed protein product [Nippostrongylus brasiliensis]|uniref:Pxr1 n=1 Tax=Nippostrongylus brasiliensis TaxID=27835 RepID=A0A0N4XUJ3_NIPBR|nr:unnamed protein product [Nippostrongylus brasiliensis]